MHLSHVLRGSDLLKLLTIAFSGLHVILQGLLKLSAGEDERHALFFHTGSLDPVDHFSPDLDDAEGMYNRYLECLWHVTCILESG
jgi:hypothetical protein